MRSIFLSHEQVFDKPLPIFKAVGAAAPAADLALLTTPDDGFLHEAEGGINYLLSDGCVDRFGRNGECGACALRPALLLEEGDKKLLHRVKDEDGGVTAEYGSYPAYLIDQSLRDMAEREFRRGALHDTGRSIHVAGAAVPVYALGGKRLIRLTLDQSGAGGYVQLRDGTVVTEGESVFLEFRPVRWLYDASLGLLLSCQALFGGMDREKAAAYLQEDFLAELGEESDDALPENAPFRVEERDELSLIRAYVEANIPVFLHGLSGDGKSDRVRQIDPQVLDIELVNENPETINGRAVYNEAQDRIVDIKPVWLRRAAHPLFRRAEQRDQADAVGHLQDRIGALCEQPLGAAAERADRRGRQRPQRIDLRPRSGRAALRALCSCIYPHDRRKLDALGGQEQDQSLCHGVFGEQ